MDSNWRPNGPGGQSGGQPGWYNGNRGGYRPRGYGNGNGNGNRRPVGQSGYDQDGYDQNGFDRNGFDRDGFNQNGYDRQGFDTNGFDQNGYDRQGYDKNGLDRNGYDRNHNQGSVGSTVGPDDGSIPEEETVAPPNTGGLPIIGAGLTKNPGGLAGLIGNPIAGFDLSGPGLLTTFSNLIGGKKK
jgi:hypothetical protein